MLERCAKLTQNKIEKMKMILSNISLIVGSCLTIAMVIFHFFFPKIFKWEKDFQRITGTNK